MSILGIIPARGGSKGILRKNLALIGDKPLIAFTIDEALKSKLDTVIVSSDDDEIIKIAKKFGAIVPFKRPFELALDKSTSIDVAIHGLREMEKINNIEYSGIMYLQPTTPFRSYKDIDESLMLLKNDSSANSVISVTDVHGFHPARMKFIDNGLLIDPSFAEKKENQNRQELTPMYIRNGAIYLTKKETLLKKSFKGKKCLAHIMSSYKSINIDTILDLEYARWIYKNYLKNENFI